VYCHWYLVWINYDTYTLNIFTTTTIAIMGGIGACVSALTSSAPQVSGRIPKLALTLALTLVRPIVGAASALAGMFLLQSNYVRIVEHPTAATLYVTAFAFGFSERLIHGIVDVIGSSGKRAETGKG
jgi:hypothetical protein